MVTSAGIKNAAHGYRGILIVQIYDVSSSKILTQVPKCEASSHLVTLPDEGDPLENQAAKLAPETARTGQALAAFQVRVGSHSCIFTEDIRSIPYAMLFLQA